MLRGSIRCCPPSLPCVYAVFVCYFVQVPWNAAVALVCCSRVVDTALVWIPVNCPRIVLTDGIVFQQRVFGAGLRHVCNSSVT